MWQRCRCLFAMPFSCTCHKYAVAVFTDLVNFRHDALCHGRFFMNFLFHPTKRFSVKVCNAILAGCLFAPESFLFFIFYQYWNYAAKLRSSHTKYAQFMTICFPAAAHHFHDNDSVLCAACSLHWQAILTNQELFAFVIARYVIIWIWYFFAFLCRHL